MKIRSTPNNQRGTTIVEIVISTCILSIMAAGIIGCFAYGFYVMELARENQRATQIILEKFETVRLYNWDQVLAPGFIPATFEDVYDPQAGSGSTGVAYHGTVAVRNVPFSSSYSSNMRELVITLTWSSSRNLSRTRTMSTFVAKDGVQNYVY
jgi:type II secretory pathway pseudopilin PulG